MTGKAKGDPRNHPFDEAAVQAHQYVLDGLTIHQKFTCDGCGARQTMDEPNKFFVEGHCEECGHITNIRETGCNYLLHT